MAAASRQGCAALIVLVLCAVDLAAQPSVREAGVPSGYFVQPFSARDGIPSNFVPTVIQDQRGYLWFGTPEGLVRSDGQVFTTFDRRNTSSFRSHNVGAIAEAADGSLWVGTGGGGIQRFADGQIVDQPQVELDHSEVTSLTVAPSGAVWIGCRGALCRVEGLVSRCFGAEDGLPSRWIAGALRAPAAQAVAVDAQGQVWVATPEGTVVANESAVDLRFESVEVVHGNVLSMTLDQHGTLWAGNDRGQVGRLTRSGFQPVVELGEPVMVGALAIEADGTLWVGTGDRGVARWDGSTVRWIREAQGLPSEQVLSLELDHENNLWVGTGGGLARVARGLITQRGEALGLAGHTVIGLSQSSSGTWVVTAEGGLSRFDGRGFTHVPLPGLRPGELRRVLETRSGAVWLGTRRGLHRWFNGELIPSNGGVADGTVSAIYEDQRGRLWVGKANGGLFASDDGASWHHWSVADGLPDPGIYTVTQGVDGKIWVGTRKGLVQMQAGDSVSSARVARVFGPGDGLDEPLIVGLHASSDGTLWIGTVSYGLVRLRDGVFQAVSEEDGLPDATVWAIVEDNHDSLWLSSNRGVSRVAKDDLEDFFSGTTSTIQAVRYGPSEGLLEPDCVGGFLSAGITTADGQPAFATVDGVALIEHPERAAVITPPPQAHVLSLEVDGVRKQVEEEITVPAGTQRVELLLGAPTQVSPQHVRVRARLVGFSDRWEQVPSHRQLTYTNLEHCRCVLELETSRDGVNWAAAGVQRIHVHALWHERWEVRIAGLLLLFVVVPGLLRLRLWQAAKRERWLRDEVAERTERLNLANQELEQANERLLTLSMADALTGLANRRKLNQALQQEWRRGRRHGSWLALVLADVDRFKDLNDGLGHGAGDEALKRIAAAIQHCARRTDDLAARIGGDEFCLLLPNTTRMHAVELAESLRQQVKALAIPTQESNGSQEYGRRVATVSVGVAVAVPSPALSTDEFLERADRALYTAKSRGRDRVVAANGEDSPPTHDLEPRG